MQKFKQFHFHGQHRSEKIIKIIRRHWFNILQQYFIVFGMIFLLFLGTQLFPLFYSSFTDNKITFWFLESIFAILIWLYAYILWIDFYFDVWIITNQRIVNIEQKALFVRQVSELKFIKIQDVSTEVKGFIPTILNYGDVHVQTAGTKERFLFHKVPDPYALKGLIVSMQTKHTQRNEAETIAKLSPFGRHHQA